MNRKGSKLGRIGTYLLAGSLAVGSEVYAQGDTSKDNPFPNPLRSFFYQNIPLFHKDIAPKPSYNDGIVPAETSPVASTNPEKPKPKSLKKNFIYSTGELTSAGDGILAKSYVNEVYVSPEENYSIRSRFSSKDKIKYFATDAKKGLERIVKKMGKDSKLTGKEKATRYYLKELAKNLISNDKASLKLLNNAVKDGIISPEEDGLYNEKGWKLKDDVYMLVVKTKSQSTPLLLYFKSKTYAEVRKKEGKLEQEIKKEEVRVEEEKDSSKTTSKYEKKEQEAIDSSKATEVREPVISDGSKTKKDTLQSAKPYDSLTTDEKRKYWEAHTSIDILWKTTENNIELLKPYDSLTTEQKEQYQREYANFWEAKDLVGVNPELYVAIEDSTKKAEVKETSGPRFGLEAGVGNNGEKTVGIFGNVSLTPWMKLEGFADYSVARGNAYSYSERTEITQRERQLIGPATYKQRTDEITTTLEDMARAEAGAGITFRISENVEIPLRVGTKILTEKEIKEGKSTIVHERNMQVLGETKTITGQTESDNQVNRLSLSAGAMYNFNNNISVGGLFNRVGEHNSGRINLRVKF
jgi:hypothetical protein